MLSQSARAIILSLVLVLPLLPLAQAVPLCEPPACGPARVLPLYIQAGRETSDAHGLSALPGDAGPGDPGTRESHILRAASPPLDFELAVSKAGAFTLNLTSPTAAEHVQGHVAVSLRPLHGPAVEIARRDFAPPPFALEPQVPVWMGGVEQTYEDLNKTLEKWFGTLSGRAAGNVVRNASDELCRSPDTLLCRQWQGHYGIGSFQPCAGAPASNLPAALVWMAAQEANRAQRSWTGEDLCARSADGTARDAAEQADDEVGLVPSLPWGGLPPFSANGSGPTLPGASGWRVVTLNATPPAWLPQDAASFRVPSGFRIVLDVQLMAVTPGPVPAMYPVVYEVGHADAKTRLDVLTLTPQAFSRMTYGASPVLPGVHTGHAANLTDADDYAFDVPAGALVDVTRLRGPSLRFTLYDPDGLPKAANDRVTASGQAGRWTLRVLQGAALEEYAFRLALVEPVPEEDGGTIHEGTHDGALGPGDNSDTWSFHVWKAQRFTLALTHGTGSAYRIEHARGQGVGIWEVEEENGTLRARASTTGTAVFRIVRDYGEGGYTLALDVDEEGDHTLLPNLSTLWTPPSQMPRPRGSLVPIWPLTGYEGGVDFSYNGTAYHLDAVGSLTALGPGIGMVARTAEGAVTHGTYESIVLEAEAGANPLVPGNAPFAYGHDALYASYAGGVLRFTEDRGMQRMDLPGPVMWWEPLVRPDGAFFVRAYDRAGAVLLVDFENETAQPHPALAHTSAFDAAGAAYRVLNETLVERIDPSTGASRVVARSDGIISDIAFGGDRLYAVLYDPMLPLQRIGVAQLEVAGFEGFRPSFTPLPPPDLLTASFEDIVDGVVVGGSPSQSGEDHRLLVRVANKGLGPAHAFDVDIFLHCTAVCRVPYWNSSRVSGLGPGEETVLEFRWRSEAHVGDQRFVVLVDRSSFGYYDAEVAESNETNNLASYRTYAWVGGQERLCHTLTQGAPYCAATRV